MPARSRRDIELMELELTAANAKIAELENETSAARKQYFKDRETLDSLTRQLSEAQAQLASAREDSARLSWLTEEAGSFQDDSFTTIKFSGDDATRTWHLDIGMKSWWGSSIRSAIDSARGVTSRPAVTETGEKDAWQDISTAPKDGTVVLLFGTRMEGGIKVISFGYYGKWNLPHGDEDWLVDYGRFTPTHWQPVPPPPQGKERE